MKRKLLSMALLLCSTIMFARFSESDSGSKVFESNNDNIEIEDGEFIYSINVYNLQNNTFIISIIGAVDEHLSGDVIIPETYTYDGEIFTVVSCDLSNTKVTSITVPNTLRYLTMIDCTELTTINWGSNVERIEFNINRYSYFCKFNLFIC